MTTAWKDEARVFFDERGLARTSDRPSLEDLCFVSGRDPRLWRDGQLYASLIDSVIAAIAATPDTALLEVGCAAGFLARGLAPRVASYTGVDVAGGALELARRLGIGNATFVIADAEELPFPDASFGAAVCYDVLTNFPSLASAEPLIEEMARVLAPGGSLLLGSIPDAALEREYAERVAEVTRQLEAEGGPAPDQPAQNGSVVGHSFERQPFVSLGERLGLAVELRDIHADNPYLGYRFNVVYHKSSA